MINYDKIKVYLKKNRFISGSYYFYKAVLEFFRFKPISFFAKNFWFLFIFINYIKLNKNPKFKIFTIYPCLFDNSDITPVDPVYLLQDVWFASHIFKRKPELHYDIGSYFKTISIISQFTKVVFIDIRPPQIEVPNLRFLKADIKKLPFPDNSVYSLSSLCVLEHIGLGRYGDELDSYGSEKAINELKRICAPGEYIYISVPVDNENKIYFNAHRAFSRDYIIELFDGFDLLDEKYIYGNQLWDAYDKNKGFGTGLYLFRKKF
jgi:SAM-dependent methyltransferase